MNVTWVDEVFAYDGSALRAHWILHRFGIADDALVAWRGPCRVADAEVADLEDLLAGSAIAGDDMVHFVWERFDAGNLDAAVLRQRLLSALAFESLAGRIHDRDQRLGLRRKGDDLWVSDAKLSISIATKSPVSTLLHFAVNVTTAGTPVRTIGLSDLGIEPEAFARDLLTAVADEEISMRAARVKVRAKPEFGS